MADDVVKEMFINETAGSTRLAIVENGRLVELYVERPDHQRMVGSIYKGVVENVIPGMQAAFVDIGYTVNAFLPFAEIGNPENLENLTLSDDEVEPAPKGRTNGNARRSRRGPDRRANRNNRGGATVQSHVDLKTGQEILVQVIKEPFAGKGPRVTTDIAIPGRLLVLVQNADFEDGDELPTAWQTGSENRARRVSPGLFGSYCLRL
ncbi:MAG: S1 RNA-binding domain-containing protein, partial [Fidelibacterota bacterium]